MFDPLTSWSRMLDAAARAADTGRRLSETLSASQTVIAERGAMMRSPFTVDPVELGRMIPEKVAAFAAAGAAVAGEWRAMQAECLSEAQHAATWAMRGRPPTLGEWSDLAARNAAHALCMIDRSVALGAVAVAPIHRSVTGNARRLRGRSRKG